MPDVRPVSVGDRAEACSQARESYWKSKRFSSRLTSIQFASISAQSDSRSATASRPIFARFVITDRTLVSAAHLPRSHGRSCPRRAYATPPAMS